MFSRLSLDRLLDSPIAKTYEQVNVVEHWDNEDIDSSFVVPVANNEKKNPNSSNLFVHTGKNGTLGLCIPSLTFICIGGGPFGLGLG